MGKFSRDKGKRGERTTVKEIKAAFPNLKDLKRGWQSRRGHDDPDVCGFYDFWIEVKQGPQPNPRQALAQATADTVTAASGERLGLVPEYSTPVAVIRDDRKKPFVVMWFDDFLKLVKRGYGDD